VRYVRRERAVWCRPLRGSGLLGIDGRKEFRHTTTAGRMSQGGGGVSDGMREVTTIEPQDCPKTQLHSQVLGL
jgi:hypothetical protein